MFVYTTNEHQVKDNLNLKMEITTNLKAEHLHQNVLSQRGTLYRVRFNLDA
jgi:hypothetical protein